MHIKNKKGLDSMKKRVFAGLLAFVFAFSMFTTVLANETVQEDNKDAQEFIIPILRDKEESVSQNKIALMSKSRDENPRITYAYTEDFYADSDTFEIELQIENMKDSRQNLILTVLDEDYNHVAKQVGVYYHQNGLVYQMELVADIDENSEYFIRFTYNGKYSLNLDIYSSYIYPITDVRIKDIEVIDANSNSFGISLANATEGENYVLFYGQSWDYGEVKREATVTSDKSLYVEFGDAIPFDRWNYIWICEEGTEEFNRWDYLDQAELYSYGVNDSEEDYRNDGISCEEYIPESATYVWFGMWSKDGFDQGYDESDIDNVDVYLFDMTTGKNVGTMADVEYLEEYGEIEGNIKITKTLDETHEYIMVFNDGYSIRIYDDFTVTSEKKLININAYDEDKNHLQVIPAEMDTFYVNVYSINISDPKNVKVELIDEMGETIAKGTYKSSMSRHKITVSGGLDVGKYILKATYGDLVCTRQIEVTEGNNSAWQNVSDTVIYDGKTYVCVSLETETLDPAKLTYKVVLNDGTVMKAKYHRSLGNAYNEKRFVVTVDEELYNTDYNNPARLEIYDGTDLIAPTYENNIKIRWVSEETEPFVYGTYNITGTTAEIFLEGFTDVGDFAICAYDELTEAGVTVDAVKTTNTSVTFNKSDLKKIHMSGNDSIELFIEEDDEYVTYVWTSLYDGLISAIMEDSFGFQKAFTSREYEALNLPYNDYAYYKLATSESGLKSETYKKIEVGLLYHIEATEGKETVYAQFKTADGKESAVMTASITIDSCGPVFSVVGEIPSSLTINENTEIEVCLEIEASEAGTICFALCDADGNIIGYESESTIAKGIGEVYGWFWSEDANYEDATTLVVYMTDIAGNMSAEQRFDISVVVSEIVEFETDEAFWVIDAATGTILDCEIYGETLNIPTEIEGISIKAIGQIAFSSSSSYVEVYVPATINSIDEDAFALWNDFILLVEKDSYAHTFAEKNYLPYEVIGEEEEMGIGIGFVTHSTYNNIVTVSAIIENTYQEEIDVNAYVAFYKQGQLVDVQPENITVYDSYQVYGQISTEEGADEARVFIWEYNDTFAPFNEYVSVDL